jgi:hypothetical protein
LAGSATLLEKRGNWLYSTNKSAGQRILKILKSAARRSSHIENAIYGH